MDLETAVEKVRSFLQTAGYSFARLEKVNYDKSQKQWYLTFDVGAIFIRLVTVTVDDETGRIVKYERPK